MKKFNVLLLLLISLLMFSCSEDDNNGRIQLTVNASKSAAKKSLYKKETNSNVVFTDFQISIRDVVFKNDDDINSNLDTDEIQFRGPYQIDLLNSTDVLSETIGDAFVPNGTYKELRFKFHKDKSLSNTHKLYDKSIYIEGTINGIPFVFWHDTSENLDLGRNTGVKVENGKVNFTVQFNINQFLNSLHTIDLTTAKDGNSDGIIEINPNDNDGNKEIAKLLKENIKKTAKILNN
ncbi:DUF4382 domain-containing protein [Lutibacter sp.]|uniref:DUF4382 domain-containing protein n=1 Tax=Lutibacter sp. TaxID=1925666 RepID=UPI002736595E|nr:DUF4382 domain-containing protein [Lutibacter sp.]MDP3312166.1 DUF4382 domain-containing protein [Lutibacter sp.]